MDEGRAGDGGDERGTRGGREAGTDAETGDEGEPAVDNEAEVRADTGGEPATGTAEPPAGLVTVRGAIYGVALLWLAAMAAFGAVQAAVYGATTATPYLLLSVVAAALSVTAGYASLRAFGLK